MKLLSALVLAGSALTAQTLDSIPFRAELSPLNEIPIIENVAASGKATIWLHVVRNTRGDVTWAAVDFNVRATFPGTASLTGLHIHRGTAAINGPVVIDSGLRDGAVDSTGKITITRQGLATSDAALAAVRDILEDSSGFYVNVHTNANPNGVMRGQLLRAVMTVSMGQLSAANELPAVQNLPATGTATLVSLLARDAQGRVASGEVTFDVQYAGFPAGTKLTGLHVHTGAADVNGPVTINSGLTGQVDVGNNGAGSLSYTMDIDPNNAASTAALAGLATTPANYYVNLHTSAQPGGAIRTQMQTADRATFPVNATGAAQVPPITNSTATAPANLTLYSLRNAEGNVVAAYSVFDVAHNFPNPTTFTGLQVNQAATGQNGPVAINSGLTGTVERGTGQGNLYFGNAITTAAGLNAVNALLQDPAGFYLNLQTSASPNGAVRAQLAPVMTEMPTVTGVFGVKGGKDDNVAGLRSRFRIAGKNLAASSASASAGTTPTSLVGTSVTLAGMPVELISVSPESIAARVPASLGLGNFPARAFPVFVTTRAGQSAVMSLLVSAQPGDN